MKDEEKKQFYQERTALKAFPVGRDISPSPLTVSGKSKHQGTRGSDRKQKESFKLLVTSSTGKKKKSHLSPLTVIDHLSSF